MSFPSVTLKLNNTISGSLNNYSSKLPDTSLMSWQKSGVFRSIIDLFFNTLITKHSFIAEKLETIFILQFFSPTHKITCITGYLLTTDDKLKYSVHHDHNWAVLNNNNNNNNNKSCVLLTQRSIIKNGSLSCLLKMPRIATVSKHKQ